SLPGCSQEILAGQSLLSPETFIKNRRNELKKLNELLISYQGKKELVEQQREERNARLKELGITVENISREMEELTAVRDNGRNPDEEKSLLTELYKQRGKLLAEGVDNKTDEAIRELMEDIKTIEKSISKQEAEQYVSSYMEQSVLIVKLSAPVFFKLISAGFVTFYCSRHILCMRLCSLFCPILRIHCIHNCHLFSLMLHRVRHFYIRGWNCQFIFCRPGIVFRLNCAGYLHNSRNRSAAMWQEPLFPVSFIKLYLSAA
ncbi:MAG: hypothetical protein K2O18_11475, partial [Oscillospiraceae bacterium]|nr:hypothetical protein [Oscillospiraceae bacterium]